MKGVFIPSSLQDAIGDNIYECLVYTIFGAWGIINEDKKLTEYCIDGKYGTRLSYSKIAEISNWRMSTMSIRRYTESLIKKGFIIAHSDSLSNKFGNIYICTDKIFDYMSREDFKIMCKRFNSTFKKSNSDNIQVIENVENQTEEDFW